MSKNENYFKLKEAISFIEIRKQIEKGEEVRLQTSDLCIQDDSGIMQFEFVDADDVKRVEIEPGVYNLGYGPNGVQLTKTELRTAKLLTSITNTQAITEEANCFFDNIHIYEELEEEKVRKILLYSDPGQGKSSTIAQYCASACINDPGTVIIRWPTSEVSSDDVSKFLSTGSQYISDATRLILVMEDIGGGEREGSHGSRSVDSALLDLLDGLQVTFKLPTLIIATTNYPQNLLSALADRPGRFDMMMELKAPSLSEKIDLMEFIGKRSIDEDAKKLLASKKAESLSIAHLKEIVIRSRLHNKSVSVVIREVLAHKERFNKAFEEREEVGF